VAAGHGSAAGTDGLLVPGRSVVHRLPAEVKILAVVVFVLAVVATPREAFWAFAMYGVVVLAVATAARVPLGTLLRRLRIEVPFLAFAVFLPIVGGSPRVDVFGMSLSQPGLWAAWNIVVKGTLGVSASILLAATTPVADLLRGLERLHLPRALTSIAGFMVRYLDVIVAEAGRMTVARQSRGYDARWLWQAKAVASSAGTLFVRSFERGERVHLAMVSRGYGGTMPRLDDRVTTTRDWSVALVLPVLAIAVAVAANVVT
jgi:cobalt/nickel transport system permease protein